MSDNHDDPFHELSPGDQKAAIDIGVAAILIGLRIPSTGKPLYDDWIVTEFARCHSVSPNTARYALRSMGRGLMAQSWTLVVVKDGAEITTRFVPAHAEEEGNVAE